MVGSGFVMSTHNIEINMAMSTWSRLTCYNRLSPAQAIRGKPRIFVSQVDVVVSCTLLSIIVNQATTQL